jgi:hypothetical protein
LCKPNPSIPVFLRFYKLGTADEAVGLESTVEPWIEGLYPALAKVSPPASQSTDKWTLDVGIGYMNSVFVVLCCDVFSVFGGQGGSIDRI